MNKSVLAQKEWIETRTDKLLDYLSEIYGFPVITDEDHLLMLRKVFEYSFDDGFRAGQSGVDPRPELTMDPK